MFEVNEAHQKSQTFSPAKVKIVQDLILSAYLKRLPAACGANNARRKQVAAISEMHVDALFKLLINAKIYPARI